MSLRALRKRETGTGYGNNNNHLAAPARTSQATLFKKASTAITSPKKSLLKTGNSVCGLDKRSQFREQKLLGRKCHSSPDLRQIGKYQNNSLLRSKSEGDVSLILASNSGDPIETVLASAALANRLHLAANSCGSIENGACGKYYCYSREIYLNK